MAAVSHVVFAFRGLNSVLKSLVRRINSSGDIVMYRFWRFGLKLPIHAPFWGVFWGIFSPYDVTHHIYRGNISPLQGEKLIFGPLSKNNTGMAALRAGLPVIMIER